MRVIEQVLIEFYDVLCNSSSHHYRHFVARQRLVLFVEHLKEFKHHAPTKKFNRPLQMKVKARSTAN